MSEEKKQLTYADAGVDIDAGNKAVLALAPIIRIRRMRLLRKSQRIFLIETSYKAPSTSLRLLGVFRIRRRSHASYLAPSRKTLIKN